MFLPDVTVMPGPDGPVLLAPGQNDFGQLFSQLFYRIGLLQESASAHAEHIINPGIVPETGRYEHLHVRVDLLDLYERFLTGAPGHHHVKYYCSDVGVALAEQLDPALAVLSYDNVITEDVQNPFAGLLDRGIVLNHENEAAPAVARRMVCNGLSRNISPRRSGYKDVEA